MAIPTTPWSERTATHHKGEIKAEDPAFVGHFPGDPAFPGVAQLRTAWRLAREDFGAEFLAGVERVKYRAPVRPGARLTLDLVPTEDEGSVSFEFRGDEELASSGVLRLGFADGAMARTIPLPELGERPPQPAIDVMLPHRGPAWFVHEVLSVPDDVDAPFWLGGRVPEDSFLVRDGRVSAIAAIEVASQAGAVAPELRRADGETRELGGFLAAVKETAFAVPNYPQDRDVVASIRTSSRSRFVTVEAEVYTVCGAELEDLARVEVKLLVQ